MSPPQRKLHLLYAPFFGSMTMWMLFILQFTTFPANALQSTPSESSTSTLMTVTPIVSTFTTIGQVHTVTITPTSPANSQNVLVQKNSSSGLGTGGAVGLTIGLVALIAIVSALVWFYFRRKRQQAAEEYANVSRRGSSAGLGGPVPSRTMSENSRYVLGTDGRQVVETWEPGDTPGSRRSRLVPVDPRLDPFAPVYQRNGDNKSRESVNTIRDDHDYSRRVVHQGPILRATNPDHNDD
jgi:cell wall integrity and stress response component